MRPKIFSFVFFCYQVLRSMRYMLLFTIFGYVSHCKHTPTCGSYALTTVKKEGLRGVGKAIVRVSRCW